jgi:hypothetical protein
MKGQGRQDDKIFRISFGIATPNIFLKSKNPDNLVILST